MIITLYRRLIGKRIYHPTEDAFEGVSDQTLRQTGILTVNQTGLNIPPYLQQSFEELRPEARKVPGLPVFLNHFEAEGMITSGIFPENPPAIAVAKLPLELIIGKKIKYRIFRTLAHKQDDIELDETILIRHIESRMPIIEGECDIRAIKGFVGNEINKYVSFLRPMSLKEGRVDFEKGWYEIGKSKREK